MKKNHNIIISGCLLIILSISSVKAQSKSYSADVEQKIKLVEKNLCGWVQTGSNDTWTLSERMKKFNINGISIAVVHNWQIEWARGYGFADISEHRPVTEQTLFQAASISKSLNSMGILRLVQEKKLDLNSDINKYLDGWKFPYDEKSGGKPITLTNLLSHTGALTIHGFPGYAKGDSLPTLVQILDGRRPANTEAVRSTGEPGKSFSYSGGGITISQLILMNITNQPYDVYMQKNVLHPLGMTSSSYTQPPTESKRSLLSTGYKPNGKEVPGKFHIYPEQAAAGLWTNPVDLCRYIIETQLAWQGKSSRVLTQEMTRLRLTPVIQDAALGTFVNSRVSGSSKYFNHNGGNEGFSCTAIGCLDNGEGVVIMINSDNGAILEEIANSVAIVYKWKDYYLPEIKKVIDIDESVAGRYIGKYDLDGTKLAISGSDSGLFLNVPGDLLWKVYFTSDSDFFVKEIRASLRFKFDRDNKVTGFTLNGTPVKKVE